MYFEIFIKFELHVFQKRVMNDHFSNLTIHGQKHDPIQKTKK